jgi:hypothetical protein
MADPNRPNNPYEPVDRDRDFGAHGDFDARAHPFSWQLWADQNRGWLALAGAGVVGALCASRLLGRPVRRAACGLAAGAEPQAALGPRTRLT